MPRTYGSVDDGNGDELLPADFCSSFLCLFSYQDVCCFDFFLARALSGTKKLTTYYLQLSNKLPAIFLPLHGKCVTSLCRNVQIWCWVGTPEKLKACAIQPTECTDHRLCIFFVENRGNRGKICSFGRYCSFFILHFPPKKYAIMLLFSVQMCF